MRQNRKKAYFLIETVVAVTIAMIFILSVYSLIICADKLAIKSKGNYSLQKYKMEIAAGLMLNNSINSNCNYNTFVKETADGICVVEIIPKHSVNGASKVNYVLWKKR